jgi:hypothetical protein
VVSLVIILTLLMTHAVSSVKLNVPAKQKHISHKTATKAFQFRFVYKRRTTLLVVTDPQRLISPVNNTSVIP